MTNSVSTFANTQQTSAAFEMVTKGITIQDNYFHCFVGAAKLPNLRKLQVNLLSTNKCPQENLPNSLNLEEIHVHSIAADLPASIELLTQLEVLNLFNAIEISPDIGALTQLQHLKIDATQELEVNPLPTEMHHLKSLRSLIIHRVRYWESLRFIQSLEKLEVLSLRFYLGEVPRGICTLKHLARLDLTSCHLEKLPSLIGDLKALQHLNLSRNKLTELPASIGELSELQLLDLYGNRLYKVPPRLGELIKLQTLDLSGNHLSAIPQELNKLTALEKLYLEGNPFKGGQ